MVRIERPNIVAGFVPHGQAATQALIDRRAQDPLAGGSKETAFQFHKGIYGPTSVKNRLQHAQSHKCCYCEVDFSGYPGDVEHFRPKGRVQQAQGLPYTYPGYYFLAYRWENLLFSCFTCNVSHKRDLFPVAHARATTLAGLDAEGSMLIDPTREDPRAHITFRFTQPHPKSPRGDATIKLLRLDRPELLRPRLSHIKHLDTLLRLARLADTPANLDDRTYAATELHASILAAAPFSSMSLDYLSSKGWPIAAAV